MLLLARADTGGEENAMDEGARELTLSTLVYECEDVVQSADTEGWPLLT